MFKRSIMLLYWVLPAKLLALSISTGDLPSDLYAGAECPIQVGVQAQPGDSGRIHWRIVFNRATLGQGEASFTCDPDGVAKHAFTITAPHARPGAPLKVALELRVGDVVTTHSIWVFNRDVFADQQNHLKALNIQVYDPKARLIKHLKAASIPFTALRSLEAADQEGGVLLLAPGSRMSEGLWETVVERSREMTVICFAPVLSNAIFPAGITSFSFSGPEYTKALDARLAPLPDSQPIWLAARKYQLVLTSDPAGHSFVTLQSATSGGALFLLAADPGEHWETRPSAPLLLNALFKKVTQHERKNHENSK